MNFIKNFERVIVDVANFHSTAELFKTTQLISSAQQWGGCKRRNRKKCAMMISFVEQKLHRQRGSVFIFFFELLLKSILFKYKKILKHKQLIKVFCICSSCILCQSQIFQEFDILFIFFFESAQTYAHLLHYRLLVKNKSLTYLHIVQMHAVQRVLEVLPLM